MKQLNLLYILCTGLFAMFFTSCKNQDVEYPDYAYSTVYFAYQYPVRTIVLGEDTYDTSLDNAHQCEIYATMGGVYANKKQINIDFVVDNTLCNKLAFGDGSSVQAMPASYYTLAGNKIALNNTLQGAVGVQFTDAFFADPNALKNTYVIPLRMTNVTNADSILSGLPIGNNPVRVNPTDWNIQPKDYTLYCVKFVNTWHGNYLRRGVDLINLGPTPKVIRHKQYVESDQVISLTTKSLSTVEMPVYLANTNGDNELCKLLLTFDNQGKCTVTTSTPGFTATGNGSFVAKGEKNSWGNKDRNAIYLGYSVTATASGKSYATTDTLVVRDRGVKIETFTPTYTK